MPKAWPASRGWGSALHSVEFMLDRLSLPPLPMLQGERVVLREPRESDVDDRLRHPIDPEEEANGRAYRFRARDLARECTHLPLCAFGFGQTLGQPAVPD